MPCGRRRPLRWIRGRTRHRARLLFQPDRLEATGLVDIDLLQQAGAQIFEFVRDIGRTNHDLPGRCVDRVMPHGKAYIAVADDEGFGIGVLVQAWRRSR